MPSSPTVSDRLRTLGRVLAFVLVGLTGASTAAAQEARHVVTVGIRPIVAFAVESGTRALIPGIERTDGFALTSNIESTRIVARLDEALPAGIRLQAVAETDLATTVGPVELTGVDEVVLASGIRRGVRRGQPLRLRVEGSALGALRRTLRRTLHIGLVDPVTGASSWQSVPVVIAGTPAGD